MCGSIGSSRRVWRERSMFSETRATTVVSQAFRFSTSLVSERLKRSQASCTASSASLERAQHAVGDGPQMGPVLLELLVQPVGVLHLTLLPRVVS